MIKHLLTTSALPSDHIRAPQFSFRSAGLTVVALVAVFGLACAQSATAATQFVMASPHVAGASTGHGKYHANFVQYLLLAAAVLIVCGAVIYACWLAGQALSAMKQRQVDHYMNDHDK